MLQPTSAFMTITPYQAECHESNIDAETGYCPGANQPATFPVYGCDIAEEDCATMMEDCAGEFVASPTSAQFDAQKECPDRRIGNIVKLRVEYDIQQLFQENQIFQIYIPKDLTQYQAYGISPRSALTKRDGSYLDSNILYEPDEDGVMKTVAAAEDCDTYDEAACRCQILENGVQETVDSDKYDALENSLKVVAYFTVSCVGDYVDDLCTDMTQVYDNVYNPNPTDGDCSQH